MFPKRNGGRRQHNANELKLVSVGIIQTSK